MLGDAAQCWGSLCRGRRVNRSLVRVLYKKLVESVITLLHAKGPTIHCRCTLKYQRQYQHITPFYVPQHPASLVASPSGIPPHLRRLTTDVIPDCDVRVCLSRWAEKLAYSGLWGLLRNLGDRLIREGSAHCCLTELRVVDKLLITFLTNRLRRKE